MQNNFHVHCHNFSSSNPCTSLTRARSNTHALHVFIPYSHLLFTSSVTLHTNLLSVNHHRVRFIGICIYVPSSSTCALKSNKQNKTKQTSFLLTKELRELGEKTIVCNRYSTYLLHFSLMHTSFCASFLCISYVLCLGLLQVLGMEHYSHLLSMSSLMVVDI